MSWVICRARKGCPSINKLGKCTQGNNMCMIEAKRGGCFVGVDCLDVDMDKSKVYGRMRSVMAIVCTALLCRLVQHERRWMQVSITSRRQRLHKGEIWESRISYLQKLPIYWPYRNMRVWVIWVFEICLVFHER